MVTRTPLIYNFGVTKGSYLPVWPVFVVGDDPRTLVFRVEADDPLYAPIVGENTDTNLEREARRRYVTATTKRRLHQVSFRQRVLLAYRTTCAVCRLGHEELLDAAHILPDAHPRGEPIVPNGLSLCKLHHAAFDRNILGVHPDLHVEIRMDILREEDGPMLQHGLQGFHEIRIGIPRAAALQPDRGFLEERYDIFRRA
jgi:putative restriction endonuclease